jgi:hypothetical protein
LGDPHKGVVLGVHNKWPVQRCYDRDSQWDDSYNVRNPQWDSLHTKKYSL